MGTGVMGTQYVILLSVDGIVRCRISSSQHPTSQVQYCVAEIPSSVLCPRISCPRFSDEIPSTAERVGAVAVGADGPASRSQCDKQPYSRGYREPAEYKFRTLLNFAL